MVITFQDNVYNNKYDSVNHPNTVPVFFYHCPQLPQMIIKQAHVTARFLMRPENKNIYRHMPLNWEYYDAKTWYDGKYPRWHDGANGGLYERGIVPAIYPVIKKQSFQAGKPNQMFLGKHDHWFYKHHQGTDVYKMMVSDLAHLQQTIDKRFWAHHPEKGLLGFKLYRRFYKIGPIEKFLPKSIIEYELDKISNISTDIVL